MTSIRMWVKEEDLAKDFRCRENAAFVEVVRKFLPSVVCQAHLLLGSLSDAEDAAQEVFEKAFRSAESLRGPRILPWLAAITRNHCFNIIKNRSRRAEIPVDPLPEIGVASNKEAILDGLPELLVALTDIEREVVLLRVIECLSYEEISIVVGMAEGSLRNVLSRALGKLRKEVNPNGV